MFESAVEGLLQQIRDQSGNAGGSAKEKPIQLEDQECDRLVRELDQYLKNVGEELEKKARSRRFDTDAARNYAQNLFDGWCAYIDPPGIWLKYVERLNPGQQARLMGEIRDALQMIQSNPPPSSAGGSPAAVDRDGSGDPPWLLRLYPIAKRLAAGLLAGVVLMFAANALVPPTKLVGDLFGFGALIVGIVLGYAGSRRFIREPQPRSSKEPATWEASEPEPVTEGWDTLRRHLTSWFAAQIHGQDTDLTPERRCEEIAKRLGLNLPSAAKIQPTKSEGYD
jgi:hypothetical protein